MRFGLHRVFLGIGSNLGDREDNCRKALEHINFRGIKVTKESSFYETLPWGVESQPSFINMVVEAETTLPPEELLIVLKDVERFMGRRKNIKWGPRIIDIDILLYDDIIVETEFEAPSGGTLQLIIPHPFMDKREFVLKPLVEIAPEIVHPLSGKTVSELFRVLVSQEEGL